MPFDALLTSAASWYVLLGLPIGAALLWVAAAVGDEAPALGSSRAVPAQAAVTGLITAAVWWLAWQSSSAAGAGDWRALFAAVAFGALAAYASGIGAGLPWHHGRRMLGAGLTGLASVACMSALHALPGDSDLGLSTGAVMTAAALLACGLILLRQPPKGRRGAGWRRSAAAIVATAALAALSRRTVGPDASQASSALLPVVVLLGVSWFLAVALRESRRRRADTQRSGERSVVLTDSLTGLPNRAALELHLAKAAAAEDKHPKPLTLMLLNLDGFKPVNVSFGHTVGDQLLRQAGHRIRRLLRDGDMLARLGTDEFAVLISDADASTETDTLAKRLIDAMAEPYRFGTREVTLSSSIGVVNYPKHGDAEKLMARADLAMQAAKRAGGARAVTYSADMDADMADDLELLRDFRHALEHDELTMVYQPKIAAGSGQITAAEALLRWRHPVRGDVSPSVFVALAERFGLVARLGDWVIECACRQARVWADRGLNMRVAINLSAQHMRQPDLARRMRAALERYRIDPTRLTCEITESLAMENTLAAQATFAQLGDLGVHISIDDFGTGYSSLAYLRKLPASEIKIDRSFVMDLEHSADARAVIDAVVKLAHALGKRVVAEGVETIRQRRILTELRCDELQGFLFAHPMAGSELLEWALDARHSDEEAFRSSLYVGNDDEKLRSQLDEKLAARPPTRLH